MKPLFGFILLTLAIAAGVASLLRRPGASADLEQHRSDAAGAVAYASLIKGADAKPAPTPAPLPTPPPQPIRAEAPTNTDVAPATLPSAATPPDLISPPPAAPLAPAARPASVAPAQPFNSGRTGRVYRRP
jgi:hypothetical protein